MVEIAQNKCGLIYTLTVILCATVFVFRMDFSRARFHRLLFNSSCSVQKKENEIFSDEIYFSEVFEKEISAKWSDEYIREKESELRTSDVIAEINGTT